MFSGHRLKSGICRTIIIASLFIIIQSCNKSPSISNSDKQAFITVYTQLTLAKIKFGKFPQKHKTAVEMILNRNNTNQEFLNEFLEKVASHAEIQQEIFQAIDKELEKYENLPPDSLERFWDSITTEM